MLLFLAYMLNLYMWGVIATMAMALGTGITLSCFALLVIFARQRAVSLNLLYSKFHLSRLLFPLLKLIVSLLIITLGVSLLLNSFTPTTGGATLFQ